MKQTPSTFTLSQLATTDHAINFCLGGGVDSTAMLILCRDNGIVPDVITFADTGGEKPETYDYVRQLDHWLIMNGFPTVTWCRLKTTTAYDDLEGNNTANATLPSLAMGKKGCSIKWKQNPQDNFLKGVNAKYDSPEDMPRNLANWHQPHPLWIESQETGRKIIKLIGYDSSPADIRRSGKFKAEDDDFIYAYPLQAAGMKRQDCIAMIIEEGLPVPIKSACWFCPASQKWELWWLAGNHPDLFMKALKIEHIAMLGKHSRWGSDECTYDKSWEEFVNKPSDQWPTTKITVGLGRAFAWNHWARENGIVDRETGAFVADRDHCIAMANELQGAGGNAADIRACA
jgi:hypothetical protein